MIINILNNKSVWKLLALFSYSKGSGYTRKEIIKLLTWNNLSLDRSLNKLIFYKIIKKNGRIIKLDFGNSDTNKLLEIIELTKQKLEYPSFELLIVLIEFVRLIESYELNSVYLFGSHAKKTASINSDIDIAVFSGIKLNLIKEKAKISDEFGKEIQLHYFKTNEKGKLVDEVIKHGVRLV